MKRFAKRLKETAMWLYCWLCDRGISAAGIVALQLSGLAAIFLSKGEPCTCAEQLDPARIAARQHNGSNCWISLKKQIPLYKHTKIPSDD